MKKIKVQLFVQGNIYVNHFSCVREIGSLIHSCKDGSTLDLSEAIIIEGDMDIRNCNVLAVGRIAYTGIVEAQQYTA